MSKLLKYTEWELNDRWYCNDTSDLAGKAGLWWIPARMLDMTPADYVRMLIEKYEPDYIKFTGNVLIYSWKKENYNKMHKFVLFINAEARKRKFFI